MAPLKTMCDEGSLLKYFSFSYLLVRVSHLPLFGSEKDIYFSEKRNFQLESTCMHHLFVFLGSFRSDQYKFNANNVSFRGVYGHWHGKLPWWIIEDFVLSESAKIVGKYSCSSTCVNFCTVFLLNCAFGR